MLSDRDSALSSAVSSARSEAAGLRGVGDDHRRREEELKRLEAEAGALQKEIREAEAGAKHRREEDERRQVRR